MELGDRVTNYCQHNYQDQLGTCNLTISQAGCFITSLGILADISPPDVNNLLQDNGGYASGCNVISDVAAQLLGIEYDGKTYDDPHSVCIAETADYTSKGYPQHFFVWLGNGNIIDPLIGFETTNNYNIKSFRLFKPKIESEQPMPDPYADPAWFERHKENVRNLYRTILIREPESEATVENYARSNSDINEIEKSFRIGASKELTNRLKTCLAVKPTVCPKPVVCENCQPFKDQVSQYTTELNKVQTERDKAEKELNTCLSDKEHLQRIGLIKSMSKWEHFLAIFS